MNLVHTPDEVFDSIQKIKAAASDFRTNFFPSKPKLLAWIDRGELFLTLRERSAFFFRKDRDFWHLYFCASDFATLPDEAASVSELRTEKIVTDLLGTEDTVSELSGPYLTLGFRPHSRLQRMARGRYTEVAKGDKAQEVVYAEPQDSQSIFGLIESSFSRYAEQPPSLHEVEEAVRQKQIRIVKSGQELAGLIFFESQKVASTVRFWVVDKRFRAHHVGSALMLDYLGMHTSVERFTLWVNSNNDNAIQKYRHYGYAPDGFVDQIVANETVFA